MPQLLLVMAAVLGAEPPPRESFAVYADVPVEVLPAGDLRLELRSVATGEVFQTTVMLPAQRLLLEGSTGIAELFELRLGLGVLAASPLSAPEVWPAMSGQLLTVLHRFERVPLRLLAGTKGTLVLGNRTELEGSATAVFDAGPWSFALQPVLLREDSFILRPAWFAGARALALRSIDAERWLFGVHLSHAGEFSARQACPFDVFRPAAEGAPNVYFQRTTAGVSGAFRPARYLQLSATVDFDSGKYSDCADFQRFELLAFDPLLTFSIAATSELFSAIAPPPPHRGD